MNETALLAKEMAVKPEVTVLTKHEARIEKVLDREVVLRNPDDKHTKFINKAYKLGFRVIVRPEFALKFKYGASILGNCVGRKSDSGTVLWAYYESLKDALKKREIAPSGFTEFYRYAGDIPNFVLGRIEHIQKNYELPIISVHSQEPLPIVVERVPPRIEPVAIWWADNPEIGTCGKKWSSNVDTVGAVIAIWDRDKEIEILEG